MGCQHLIKMPFYLARTQQSPRNIAALVGLSVYVKKKTLP